MSRQWISLGFCLLCFPLLAKPILVEKVQVKEEEEATLLIVQGKVGKPLSKLFVALTFQGKTTPRYFLPLKGKEFSWQLSTTRRFLFGKYKLLFFTQEGETLEEYEFTYGTPQEIAREKQDLKEHMADLIQSTGESLRRIYEGSAFFWNSILFLHDQFPDLLVKRYPQILSNWQTYHIFCRSLLRMNRRNIEEFRSSLFLHPYTEELKKLMECIQKGSQMLSQTSQWLRQKREELRTNSPQFRSTTPPWEKEIQNLQKSLQKLSSPFLPSPPRQTDSILKQSFAGTIEKGFVRENRLLFEISFDPQIWELEFWPILPHIRLQWRLREAPEITASLEVSRHPLAKTYRDLQLLTVIMAQESWPGFRKLKSHSFRAKMVGKEWEGFEFTFITERSNLRGKWVYLNRVYQIFLPDKKTVYSLRFSAPKEIFQKYQSSFEKLIQSFKILGNP